jgi:hypothetical protein
LTLSSLQETLSFLNIACKALKNISLNMKTSTTSTVTNHSAISTITSSAASEGEPEFSDALESQVEELDEQEDITAATSSSPQEQSHTSDSSSWRRLLFPFSSPNPSSLVAPDETSDNATPSASIQDSLTTTPLRDNSFTRSDKRVQDDFVVWESTPHQDDSVIMSEALSTPLLQFTPSQQFRHEIDEEDYDTMLAPPTTLRRTPSSWSHLSRNRRPSLNGLNWLNVLAFVAYATVFVWTTIAYWQRHDDDTTQNQDDDDNPNSENNSSMLFREMFLIVSKASTIQHLPLLTPSHWFTWYATRFPLIVLQASFCVAQLLPIYRNRSVVQSGGGVGFTFCQVCVLQLVATLCWSATMNLQSMMQQQQVYDSFFYSVNNDLPLQESLTQQKHTVMQEDHNNHHDWAWRMLMLLQTLATTMSVLLLASLWMRRSSVSVSTSGSSSYCSVVRRIIDYIVLELPFSWQLGAVCVELVHLLSVLVLQWDSPWRPKEYGAWPRAVDYMGLAWLLPLALFCLLGWRPSIGSQAADREDDHVMNALLLQQLSSAFASPAPAWRPDFCLPAVILVAYVSFAMRLQQLQRLAFHGDKDAAAAIHFYGGTEVAESFVIDSYTLTATVGVVWILALVVWLSRQFCTIRVVQVVLEDDY